MNNFPITPAATYRLQFNRDFRFADARALGPYLHALGVTDLYASPLLAARRGSPHGYDVTDPARLNPELGGEKDFAALVEALEQHEMGLLLDIVPNHMAAGSENPWWRDVLRNGPESPYAAFFDIDWRPAAGTGPAGKVLLPVLGAPYGEALENGELTIALAEDGFWLSYRKLRFPLNRASSVRLLEHGLKRLAKNPGFNHPAAAQLLDLIASLKGLPERGKDENPGKSGGTGEPEELGTPGEPGESAGTGGLRKELGTPGGAARRQTAWERLWRLYSEQPGIKAFIDENLRIINGKKGDPQSFNLLDRIIREQFYRPAFWRVAGEEINYRRFFDVSDLVSLRTEEESVFAAAHALVFKLIAAGRVTGLRIDHIDGLRDPQVYLNRLQEHLGKEKTAGAEAAGAGETAAEAESGAAEAGTTEAAGAAGAETTETAGAASAAAGAAGGTEAEKRGAMEALETARPPGRRPAFYVVAEKILGDDEELPAGWPVHGTTGYDFLNALNGLFVDRRSAAALDELYSRMGGPETEKNFATVVYLQKKKVMAELFASEVSNLVQMLGRLAQADRYGRDLTGSELKEALTEVTACLPVYRTYIRDFAVTERDRRYIEGAVSETVRRRPAARPACVFLRRVLLLAFPDYLAAEQKREWLNFVMRWQQFTGPIMAKGFEDTALYVYNRLVSLNEVGGDPGRTAGIPVVEFHRRNRVRQARRPHTLNATSTHDTKRSEDVRARINVLSEIPAAWTQAVERWHRWNQPKKPVVNGAPVPDGNMELLIYQTLIGAWPLREEEVSSFQERLRAYLVKAAREAKIHTSWLAPNAGYERALEDFVTAILEPSEENRFLPDFLQFQKIPAFYGALNSLAQVLLKIASPGVPDFYQGTELWNFSLVDPDNRRPVDFQVRMEVLKTLQNWNNAKTRNGENKENERGGWKLALAGELLQRWEDGRVKLYLTYQVLHVRRTHRDLFLAGEYIPLVAAGPRDEHICAFARHLGGDWVLAAAPRLSARLMLESATQCADFSNNEPLLPLPPLAFPLGEGVWGETSLLLPAHAPDRWRNILTGEVVQTATAAQNPPHPPGSNLHPPEYKALPIAAVLRNFPVALLAGIPA
ncbi:MAG: malto-oligosyltrehalose synthase [Bacillota bacterium]